MESNESFRYRRDEVEVARARRAVRRSLVDGQVGADAVADLELVVAELVTNAVEHGTGSWVVVECDVDPIVVTISVINGGACDLGDPSDWIMPPADSIAGRGLALVRTLVDDVDWFETDGQMQVRVVRRHGVG